MKVRVVVIGGATGFWIAPGPRGLVVRTSPGRPATRRSALSGASVLLWDRGGTAYRLETPPVCGSCRDRTFDRGRIKVTAERRTLASCQKLGAGGSRISTATPSTRRSSCCGARAARQAGDRRRLGPRAVVTTASYEARKFGVGSASRRLAGAAAVPGRDLHPARLPRLPRDLQRGDGRSCASSWSVVAGGGARRGLRRSDATSPKPLRVLRELVAAVAQAHRASSISVGDRAEQARSPRSRRTSGSRAASSCSAARRRACASRGHSPRLIPGIGPKTAERLAALGFHTIGQLQAAPEEASWRALRHAPGPVAAGRARTSTTTTPVEPVSGAAKSRSTETTFDHDIAELEELEEVLRRLAGELCEQLPGARQLRGRTIAIKVRLDDWTTVTRARTVERADERPARSPTSRSSCCAPTTRRARCGCWASACPDSISQKPPPMTSNWHFRCSVYPR